MGPQWVEMEVAFALELSLRPLQIDFLFPVLVEQTLACGRAANSIIPLFHYVNYYTCTQLHMFCTSLQGGQSMLTTTRLPQFAHAAF